MISANQQCASQGEEDQRIIFSDIIRYLFKIGFRKQQNEYRQHDTNHTECHRKMIKYHHAAI